MLQLTRHPDTPSGAIEIEAEAVRAGPGLLRLRYRLSGAGGVALPSPGASERTDELWRHTCFEAFVRAEGREGYVEVNLSPSTQWAAYGFDGYRQGMRPANVPPPRIEVRRGVGRFELDSRLELHGFGLDDLDWRVGLCAVVEETGGGLSWWALKHPPGKPDFHHRDCFALELPGSREP
jgi:hypothetical protein